MATLFLFPDVENFKSFVNFVFDECPSFFFCVISVTLLFFFGLLCDNFYDDLCLLYYAMSNRTENLKRKRDPTFVASEKMALVDLVEKHFAIVECKKTDATTIRSKNQEWQKIAEEFNSVSSVHPREWIVLKNCWENLKKRAKSEQTARNQHYLGTGGGPPRKLTVDPAIDRVLDLIQTRVSGFVNVYDSDGTHILASGNNPSTSVADQAPQNDILLYSNDASATPVLDVQDSTEAAVVTETAAATFEVDWSQYTPAMLRAPVTTALVASRSPSPEATGSRVEPPPHKRTTITPPRLVIL
ncbi:uncharacterized protein LOC111364840 [Spodoptera litura]|uniref:Regulatory protein zeste n=1 Tax=Spodoptera litura TaxID=69820 RepID=A0A9J7EWV2_SPOLT|nr:uncharacterized protein LOC111364840 [Spodoptera litura]